MPITLLFTFSQMPLILRHSLDDKTGEKAGQGRQIGDEPWSSSPRTTS